MNEFASGLNKEIWQPINKNPCNQLFPFFPGKVPVKKQKKS
jgi:hypothetical protein